MSTDGTSTGNRAAGEAGVLVIRVWRDAPAAGFRARLTTDEGTGAVLGSPDEVLAAVRRWLADRGRRGPSADTRHTAG